MTHARGLFDAEGKPKTSNVSCEQATVHQVFERVRANVTHFGSEVDHIVTTRGIGDGWLVGIEFQTTERDQAARMWHRIFEADEIWPGPPALALCDAYEGSVDMRAKGES